MDCPREIVHARLLRPHGHGMDDKVNHREEIADIAYFAWCLHISCTRWSTLTFPSRFVTTRSASLYKRSRGRREYGGKPRPPFATAWTQSLSYNHDLLLLYLPWSGRASCAPASGTAIFEKLLAAVQA